MMTKTAFAEYLVLEFIKSEFFRDRRPYDDVDVVYLSLKDMMACFVKDDADYTDLRPLNKYVPQCTSLGIALEQLGVLDDEYKDYIANRDGYMVFNLGVAFSDIRNELNSWTRMDKPVFNLKKLANDNNLMISSLFDINLTVRDIMCMLPDTSATSE